ncbi:unnamed protein product [Brachionus calyciflorus]|uniref:Heparan-alpha-glucosaminide N-acetyltransferase catalytic domain-containing protein n=1 Tax=Brachionus calyciflorus TaxID=104777 RepID=A0A813XZV0_9BILA|nr:unnamed protein product [Brachionus calyciflorus]
MKFKFLLICFITCLLCHRISTSDSTNSTITFHTNSTQSIAITLNNIKCKQCKLTKLGEISHLINLTISLDTFYPHYFIYFKLTDTNEPLCSDSISKKSLQLNEKSIYKIQIDVLNDEKYNCNFLTVYPGIENVYNPLIIVMSILLGLAFLYPVIKLGYTKYMHRVSNSYIGMDQPIINEDHEGLLRPQTQSTRVKSIDVLRGICLSIMIFVNYGAGGYAVLDHAVWNGLNLADTVFPLFIFLMGVSLPLSFRGQLRQENFSISKILQKIFRRTLLLFFFGLVTSNSSDLKLNELRIMGVLQRFSISYLINSLVELVCLKFNNYEYNLMNRNEEKFIELFRYPIQWLTSGFFVLIWLLLTFLLPFDNCKPGYLGPGGLHENGSHFNCTGGAAGYIDRKILGLKHIYQSPTCKIVYKNTIGYDPEGLLGSLNSCVLTSLGVLTGHIFIHYQETAKRVARFMFYGVCLGLIGLSLCKFSIDDGWIPINKNLWSLSFILVMASIGLISLSILYIFVDAFKWYTGTPFLYMGRNSIVVYIGHIVFGNYFPNLNFGDGHLAVLLNNVYWVCVWFFVSGYMNFKRIYINF